MFQNRKRTAIISAGLVIVVFLSVFVFEKTVKAYPSAWDRYDHIWEGINQVIFQEEKSEMDKYNSTYQLVPGDDELLAHGRQDWPTGVEYGNYFYTNLTVDAERKMMSKWFVSGYGPFLDYANHNISNAEADSINFNEVNNNYTNSNFVYAASDQESLADAKSVAMLRFTSVAGDLPALFMNSDYNSLSDNLVNNLESHSVKNVVVVGGEQRLSDMFAIGGKFNIIRVGGKERNHTFDLLEKTESVSATLYNVANMPTLNEQGYVMDIIGDDFSPANLVEIETALQNHDFEEAAQIILDTKHGSEDNISNGQYAVMIGTKESATSTKAKFLISYYLSLDAEGLSGGVYQYLGQDYAYDNGNSDGDPEEPPMDDGGVQAVIEAPDEIEAGEDFVLDGSGSIATGSIPGETNADGTPKQDRVNEYWWSFDPTGKDRGASPKEGKYYDTWFAWSGDEYEVDVDLRAVSKTGKSGKDTETITVTAPIPKPKITITGTLKENRKFTLSSEGSTGNNHYPIVSYDWSITGTNANSVRYEGDLHNATAKDMLIKKAGDYTVKLTVVNSIGLSATASQNITIQPDEYPVNDFNFIPMVLRNPDDSNYATFDLRDTGGSPDEDIIDKRIWIYAYDSDNDGDFKDEQHYVYDNNVWRLLGDYSSISNLDINSVNDGNQAKVFLKTKEVGKYNFELIVREKFGQPTIEQFITPEDIKVKRSF